jgi:hypothetical protein
MSPLVWCPGSAPNAKSFYQIGVWIFSLMLRPGRGSPGSIGHTWRRGHRGVLASAASGGRSAREHSALFHCHLEVCLQSCALPAMDQRGQNGLQRKQHVSGLPLGDDNRCCAHEMTVFLQRCFYAVDNPEHTNNSLAVTQSSFELLHCTPLNPS